MAFDFSSLFGKDMASTMSKGTAKLFGKVTVLYAKKFKKGFMKHAMIDDKDLEDFDALKNSMSGLASSGLNVFGVILQLLDAMGVLQPIMGLFQAVLQAIGGGVMEKLVPAIEALAEALFSDKMMSIWNTLGQAIGSFVGEIVGFVAKLFSDPELFAVLKVFGKVVLGVINALSVAIGWLFDILGGMTAQQLGALFYAIGIGLAFLFGLMIGGPLGIIVGAAAAITAAIVLSPLLHLAEGGYVPPTSGGTHVIIGEGGEGEWVIPESKMGSGDQDLLWATEDNGSKLDKLIKIISLRNGLE